MKGKRHTTEDKLRILRDADGGKHIVEVCKEKNISAVTLVVLSELCPCAGLITVDDDFRRYRRFRHQAIPLVNPNRA